MPRLLLLHIALGHFLQLSINRGHQAVELGLGHGLDAHEYTPGSREIFRPNAGFRSWFAFNKGGPQKVGRQGHMHRRLLVPIILMATSASIRADEIADWNRNMFHAAQVAGTSGI